jgi:hypothetical protein
MQGILLVSVAIDCDAPLERAELIAQLSIKLNLEGSDMFLGVW